MRRIDSTDDIADGLLDLAQKDVRLARAIELSGPVPLRRQPPGYAALAEIILSQMVSKTSANALWRRLELAAERDKPGGHSCAQSGGVARSRVVTRQGRDTEPGRPGGDCRRA